MRKKRAALAAARRLRQAKEDEAKLCALPSTFPLFAALPLLIILKRLATHAGTWRQQRQSNSGALSGALTKHWLGCNSAQQKAALAAMEAEEPPKRRRRRNVVRPFKRRKVTLSYEEDRTLLRAWIR